eukprot:CAMPEP_0177606698 /NCGR_PEP_ID=MMETSP0419_2-20121207/17455_1 /TAXON_ID=582737 /ORGANISM="Tetraselmis sp., Strain GSL018" /LENGTH=502 /DNA_ID=CAMNT_0019101095 /DNA_START=584 /DNA_END=2092 /DNA_ORIENTATION=-
MFNYTFAVSQERDIGDSSRSSISIFEAPPWRDEIKPLRRLSFPSIEQRNNAGLEGLSYDPVRNKLIAGQEEDPMQIWEIDPDSGDAKKVFNEASETKLLRDFASVYKRPGDSGLYVLSEPSERVFYLDKHGRCVDGQVKLVDGKMPEGVTFTPDGKFMVIVGEPNELFIYSSTGDCEFIAGDRGAPRASGEQGTSSSEPEAAQSSGAAERAGAVESVPAMVVTPGYCNYDNCQGGAQGSEWCQRNVHFCVGDCGGLWCSEFQGVPPISLGTYVDPESGPDLGEPTTKLSESNPRGSGAVDGGSLEKGYEALMYLLTDGMELDASGKESLREAVAFEVFGDTEAAVHVTVSAVDKRNRRLLSSPKGDADVEAVLQAETTAHATHLSNTMSLVVSSGKILTLLRSSGLRNLQNISVHSTAIRTAVGKPKRIPRSSEEDGTNRIGITDCDETRGSFCCLAILAAALGIVLSVGFLAARRIQSSHVPEDSFFVCRDCKLQESPGQM